MATLSLHAPASADRKIRAAARRRRMPVSRFLRETAETAAAIESTGGLGRELEKLAIDGMAIAAVAKMRARARACAAMKKSPADVASVVKATRRARRSGA